MEEKKNCFLDKDRECTSFCKAFDSDIPGFCIILSFFLITCCKKGPTFPQSPKPPEVFT